MIERCIHALSVLVWRVRPGETVTACRAPVEIGAASPEPEAVCALVGLVKARLFVIVPPFVPPVGVRLEVYASEILLGLLPCDESPGRARAL